MILIFWGKSQESHVRWTGGDPQILSHEGCENGGYLRDLRVFGRCSMLKISGIWRKNWR